MAKKVTDKTSQDQQQPYDNLLKSLLEGQEKQMLPYFVPDAEYLETLNVEIVRTPLRVDRVYLVRHKGRKKIAHLEFTFHFRVFPLWQLKAEQYVYEHAVVMYALLPTMEGANAPLLHKAINEMVEYYKGNDTRLAQEFRWMGIVVRRVKTMPRTDKREIQERLNMWDDLMEKDPKMRKIRKESEAKGRTEGIKEGIKEGIEKGIKEGMVEGLRKAIVTTVRLHFPGLTELAQQRVAQISKPEKLNLLFEQIAVAPDEDRARLLLDLVAA